MASLAESGQQTPIVVVLASDQQDRYLVIDGHKRVAVLQQLGRDTIEATVWAMSEAEARCCTGRCAAVHRKARWNKAGCCRRWSNVLVTRCRSWRAASTAA